ncbi:hypothetical protein TNCV_560981 [Trichonephila clavipes]|nr:hypothetical protein TNCV_560981 [Trichonephila clavipes]
MTVVPHNLSEKILEPETDEKKVKLIRSNNFRLNKREKVHFIAVKYTKQSNEKPCENKTISVNTDIFTEHKSQIFKQQNPYR